LGQHQAERNGSLTGKADVTSAGTVFFHLPRSSHAMKWIGSLSAMGFCAALALNAAVAADFPSKTITLVAPYSAGGNADATARLLAEKLSDKVGKPVIVENKPGAGTMLAAEHVARAAPDGYTLLLTGSSVVVA